MSQILRKHCRQGDSRQGDRDLSAGDFMSKSPRIKEQVFIRVEGLTLT